MWIKLLIATVLSTIVIGSGTAKAQQDNSLLLEDNTSLKMSSVLPREKPKVYKVEAVKPIEHIVQEGETLESISKLHTTTWKRLWDKNSILEHPDKIKPGERLIIPRPEELLPDRAVPTPVSIKADPIIPEGSIPSRVKRPGGPNSYTFGYCTWYVKQKRPDLPNNLGNADTWYIRAKAQGLSGGSTPSVGAVGVTKAYMHVVYIIGVSGNRVTVSEMNYIGWNRISSRTAPASEFNYIY